MRIFGVEYKYISKFLYSHRFLIFIYGILFTVLSIGFAQQTENILLFILGVLAIITGIYYEEAYQNA